MSAQEGGRASDKMLGYERHIYRSRADFEYLDRTRREGQLERDVNNIKEIEEL